MKTHSTELTNMLFLLSHAVERISTVLEAELKKEEKSYKQEIKMRYNAMMRSLAALRRDTATFNEISLLLDAHNWDAMHSDANYLSRLVAYICDRADQEPHKSRLIEDYIRSMPPKGCIDDRFIEENFTLK